MNFVKIARDLLENKIRRTRRTKVLEKLFLPKYFVRRKHIFSLF